MTRAALALVIAAACNAPSSPPQQSPPRPSPPQQSPRPLPSLPRPLAPLPPFPHGSLFALAGEPNALAVGPQSQVSFDAGFVNGTASAASHAELHGSLTVAGDVALASHALIDGDLTTGGALSLGAKASVTGSVTQHASVTPVVLPTTDQLLSAIGLSFGNAAPDVIVAQQARIDLAPGRRRVAAVELGPGATLTVTGPVDLEVSDHVALAAQSSIVVQAGGRLRLHVRGRLDVGPHASITQTAASRNALVVLLGPSAQATFAPGVAFGPGLFYAPQSTLAAGAPGEPLDGIAAFSGAIVARRVATSEHAAMTLDAGYLVCPFATAGPTIAIAHPSSIELGVAPSTVSVAVTGTIADVSTVASATITDAAGTSPLTIAAGGAFTATAHLRADGDPTSICVAAVGCSGQPAEQCVLVSVRHDIDFVFISPQPGAILSVSQVNITGRVVKGALASIQAGGVTGVVSGTEFTIPQVPLAPGLNAIDVRATAVGGDVHRRSLLVSSGAMPVQELDLAIAPDRRVTIERRASRQPLAFRPPDDGPMQYRMLDASGRELYRAGIPGSIAPYWHKFDPVTGQLSNPRGTVRVGHAVVLVPALASPTTLEFLDGLAPVGRASL